MLRKSLALVLVLATWPMIGATCPNLTESVQIQQAREDRIEALNSIKEVSEESDQILIGRILSTTEEQRPVSEIYRTPDSKHERMGQVVFGRSVVEPIKELKGVAPNPFSLTYTRDESTIEIGCRGMRYFQTIGYLMETYRYLLYVRKGEVIRANRIIDWFDDELSVNEELRMLNIDGAADEND